MFKSNTDMVLHYCKELLADGQEYAVPEIRAYVNAHTGEKGIDGEPLSAQVVYSALAYNFERTGRGVYRDPSPEIQRNVPPLTETEKLLCGLDQVEESLSNAFSLSYCDLPLTGKRLQELFSIVIQIRILIRQARELTSLEAPALAEEPLAAGGQGEPEPELKGPGMGLTM